MAKLRGAEVTALASGGHIAFVKDLGADHVVDRTTPYEETLEGFDMVLDAYGPEAQARSWGLLKKGGILVTLVAPPWKKPQHSTAFAQPWSSARPTRPSLPRLIAMLRLERDRKSTRLNSSN